MTLPRQYSQEGPKRTCAPAAVDSGYMASMKAFMPYVLSHLESIRVTLKNSRAAVVCNPIR